MSVNGLSPFAIERFGGLNWAIDPEELAFNGALDLSNVMFDKNGMLRSRYGHIRHLDTPGGGAFPRSIMGFRGQGDLLNLLVGQGNQVLTYDSTIAGPSATFATGAGSFGMTAFGTPTTAYAFAGNGFDPAQRWDGSAWSAPTVTVTGGTNGPLPKAGVLGVTPWDNRLIATGFKYGVTDGGPGNAAGTSSRSHVWFSEPGDPLTWDHNNFVQLHPGDGDWIVAIAVYNNQLFVFKQTAFFVFYGVSSDSTGKPVFNYRTVSGVGMQPSGTYSGVDPEAVTVGPDGVYFRARGGIYRTSGSAAVEVSAQIRPYFRIDGGYPFNTNAALRELNDVRSMVWWRDRLFVSYRGTSANGLLVWDPQLDAWSIWDVPVGIMTLWGTGTFSDPSLFFTKETSFNPTGLFYFDSGLPQDWLTGFGGSATQVPWYYQSGFSDLGHPAAEKTIRETEAVLRVLGQPATLNLEWIRDFKAATSGQAVSPEGPSTAVTRGLNRYAQTGELLSFRLSSSAGMAVHRLVPMLREVRGVGEVTS